jgi:hypothetical protein
VGGGAGAVIYALTLAALSVVDSSTATQTFTPGAPTTVFTITDFTYTAKSEVRAYTTTILVDTRIGRVSASPADATEYTLTMPIGSLGGVLTLGAPGITTGTTLTVYRLVPLTQEASFKYQGRWSPWAQERAMDKLTMIWQYLDTTQALPQDLVDDHIVGFHPHPYLRLLGVNGGQGAYGGTGSGDDLTLQAIVSGPRTGSTIVFGTAALYDADLDLLEIGSTGGGISDKLEVTGSAAADADLTTPIIYGSAVTDNDLTITPNADAANGAVWFGDRLVFDEDNGRLGIGTDVEPAYTLHLTDGDMVVGSDLNLLATGDIEELTTAANIEISGDTSSPGSSAAGLTFFGTTHATYPNDAYTYADSLFFADTVGDVFVLFSATLSHYIDGQVAGRRGYVAGGAGSTSMRNPADCGGEVGLTADTAQYDLENADSGNKGCMVTVKRTVDTGAGDTVTVAPHASDYVVGTCLTSSDAAADDTTVVQDSGVASKGWVTDQGAHLAHCTPNCGIRGDYITVVSDGTDTWWIVACRGNWKPVP